MHKRISGSTSEGIDACLRHLDRVNVPSFVLDRTGRILYANDEWRTLLGSGASAEWEWLEPLPKDEATYVRRAFERAFEADRGVEIEFDVRRRGGSLAVLACSAGTVRMQEGAEPVLLGLCWNITERHRNEERLAFMAGHDPLTGLANRRAFEEALARAASRAERGAMSALLLLDLDNLKHFNDNRGHLEGDQALVNLAMLLRTQVRAGDLPARIGGDEFAVLFEGIGVSEAEEIADRIRESTAAEFVTGARTHGLGVSGGIAVLDTKMSPRTAFDRADAAMYAAKAAGRNRIMVWSPEVGASTAPERLTLRVREAFASDGFHLVFQPVVRLADNSVAYFESFLRMGSDDGIDLSPREFLPMVDRLGLMPRLTRRVVELALWELAANPGTALSVNLAPSDLSDEELLTDLASVISGAKSAYGRLLFEISEATLLSNVAGGRVWMERLSECGCRFVLDEFGTGMGMFALLRERHIEHIKLSRAAMRSLSSGEESRSFVQAVRELIESQGKAAVASFIESDDLLGEAREAGFSYGQGFGVGEPVGDLASLVARFGTRE